ncbi:T9SS type A sorting domain-containing protein [bacterium]|nr:T9SS type A sorting domain-containing protein [bacterium]
MSARRPILPAVLLIALAALRAAAAPGAVQLRAVTLRPGEPLPAARGSEAGDGLRILHFDRAPGAAERAAIAAAGGEILAYVPENAYLLRVDAAAATRLATLAGVDLLVDYRPEWRLAPELTEGAARAGNAPLPLTLSFAPDTPIALRADQAVALGAALSRTSERAARPRLWLSAPAALLPALAALPDLLWISPTLPASDRNNDSSWIVQSGTLGLRPIWDRGLHGEGQIIGHIDSNFFPESCFFADPGGAPIGPTHRKVVFLGEYPGWGGSHGTHTAGTAAGDAAPVDPGVGTELRGGAWAARLAHSNYDAAGERDLYADLLAHHLVGARVHTNSWGQDFVTNYTEYCADIDAYSHDREEGLVVWAVTNQAVLYTPENAKSTLAVAGSYTNDTLGGIYRGFHQHYSGGLGPTVDGRRKPELHAPGYGIRSANALPCGNTVMSGTSMASPAVAAAAALARQYLVEGWWPSGAPVAGDSLIPSGALLRALLVNSTLPMDSLPAGYPNDLEGWGRLRLEEALYFAGDSRELWLDEKRNGEGLESGELTLYRMTVESAAEPLAVTLAFTDPPGEPFVAEPVVNDLDLELRSPSGQLYLGNVFDAERGESALGGDADPVNTLERALIAAPQPGSWEIRVRARRVPLGPQGYALAANGDFAGEVLSYRPDADFLVVGLSYPNPFRPAAGTATLRFELRADQRGALVIYDLAGRRVRQLARGRLLAGISQLAWDGRDDGGEPAASGIYFARLESSGGDRSRAVRIVLIR